MPRSSSAILLVGLLVMRALLGLGGGSAVWCEVGHHQHDSQCSHVHGDNCEEGLLTLLPVPTDFHDLDCECTVENQIGGDVFTAPAREAGFEIASAAAVSDWVYSADLDLRVASFRGPPRLGSDAVHALRGRLAVVESTRLNI